jgi:3-oxoacyl-[acyl-carrier-protein] synthase II
VDRRLDLRGMDLFSRYAAVASRLALERADLRPGPQEMSDVGMVMGIAAGPGQGEEDHLTAVIQSGFEIDRLGAFPYVVPNEAAGNVARALMLRGHSSVIATGQGAGLFALMSSAIALEQGHASVLLASAADELTERTLTDGYKVGLWGPGTEVLPGEGAAALVLETDSSAASRGAKIMAEIAGYGMATDIDNPIRADGTALFSALTTALERADLKPEQIQYATACLGGSPTDALTLKAIEKVIGGRKIQIFNLSERIGFGEATLPLFELSYALAKSEPGAHIAACSLSPEGFAAAVIVRAAGSR